MPDSVPVARERLAAAGEACGIRIPELYLPAPGVDLGRFAVVACDQFTSEPAYWTEAAQIAGDAPSALNLVLPELYLEHAGDVPVETRIRRINENMRAYLEQGILQSIGEAAVVLRRTTPGRSGRLGLVLAIDLERYDFRPGNRQLIRATEGTVLDRIPPRAAIRRDAPLELPHVQLLIDDPGHTVIEPLYVAAEQASQPLYDFELMLGGGHLAGYRTDAADPALLDALASLSRLESLASDGLLFAVGDGNHSLATAKAHYERLKAETGAAGSAGSHPARFALVEVINIHDPGLEFEPIHRVVFDIDPAAFRAEAETFFGAGTVVPETAETGGGPDLPPIQPDGLDLPLIQPDGRHRLRIASTGGRLAADVVTRFIDDLVQRRGGRIDYIHGASAVAALARQGASGILLPPLDKNAFFATIARDGILPRKTFSMGEAHEKRYYLEARKII